MLLKNVLVAVDGSENSHRALDFALDLGEKFNAAIMILNVSGSLTMGAVPEESTAYSGGGMAVFAKDLLKIHEEILSKAVARAKKVKPNLTISSMLREGDPALEIVNAAKEGGFDVIAVGHKGLSKMKELFLGSTSEKVAHLAPCPVIIVR
jgi:nucleotide-binding universal stress UspA family protein